MEDGSPQSLPRRSLFFIGIIFIVEQQLHLMNKIVKMKMKRTGMKTLKNDEEVDCQWKMEEDSQSR